MSTTFDFQDGHGPVPAHRHKNADGTEGGWVANTARVSGNALVYGNARVSGDALVSGNALVYGNARVYGDAQVSGNALVYGNALVSGNALVYGDALVSGDAYLAWGFMRYRWTIHREKDNTPILVYGSERHSVAEWKKDITKIVARHVADTKQRGEFKKIITALLGMAATIPSVKRAKGGA